MRSRDESPVSGRERRKIATRRALRRATLDLALERGFESITTDEIAAAAGVSPRTFFNYFDTKEDAALIELFAIADEDLAALAAGGAPGEVWGDLTRMFTADVERVEHEGPDLPRYMALHSQTPFLQARQQSRFFEFIGQLTMAVEARLRDGHEWRLRAGVMAGSCFTAVRVGLGIWVADGCPGPAGRYVTDAFAVFDDSFAVGDPPG